MRPVKILLGTFLLTLFLWGVMSWPLPEHSSSGIPSSCHNLEKRNVRAMIPGDHLQFLYHLWLAKDTFLGPTPLFYNLYEFNTGSDEERYSRSTYYLPFSLAFALTADAFGHAFAFNFTGFMSLWVTAVFTWLLAHRYCRSRTITALSTTVALIFPYRWFTLLGGSPTGLAMMWVPVIFFGLDILVRNRKAWGAALAGAALFVSGWADSHVFFFTALAAPCWCIVSYAYNQQRLLPSVGDIKRWLTAAIPLLFFAFLVVLQARGVKSDLGDTAIASGPRDFREVAIFSPHLAGTFASTTAGRDAQIYFGYGIAALLGLGLVAIAIKRIRTRGPSPGAIVAAGLLLAGVVGVVMLSTGTNMPGRLRTWSLLCRAIPPYGMVRQSAKVYVLLPTLLATASALLMPYLLWMLGLKNRKRTIAFCTVAALAMLIEYAVRINPTICLLDHEQPAYAAVADDAAAKGIPPHVICLPLWPGDSHWTSINQYYVSRYRVRMINGYRPTVRRQYFDEVFERFESLNKGFCTDSQLDELLGKGIHYIVLHEDAYPEKVSHFAVAHTLHGLLAHPRVRLLKQGGPVWAFELVDAPLGIADPLPDWNQRMPSRLWQAERAASTNTTVFESEESSAHRYARLDGAGAAIKTSTYPVHSVTGLCYMVRARGQCTLRTTVSVAGEIPRTDDLAVETTDWTWLIVPIPSFSGYRKVRLGLSLPETGALDADVIVLATSAWNPVDFPETLTLPAPVFFHAGYTDLETLEVVLRPEREPADAIFYGPKLPVPKGVYLVELDYTTPAPGGTRLGTLRPRYPNRATRPTDVIAGEPARLIYTQEANIRMAFDLVYTRNAEMRIRNVLIRRTDEQ